MNRLTTTLTILLLMCFGASEVRAQNDPVLAGMILLYTDKAQKELKSLWTHSARLSVMQPRYTVSTTR